LASQLTPSGVVIRLRSAADFFISAAALASLSPAERPAISVSSKKSSVFGTAGLFCQISFIGLAAHGTQSTSAVPSFFGNRSSPDTVTVQLS